MPGCSHAASPGAPSDAFEDRAPSACCSCSVSSTRSSANSKPRPSGRTAAAARPDLPIAYTLRAWLISQRARVPAIRPRQGAGPQLAPVASAATLTTRYPVAIDNNPDEQQIKPSPPYTVSTNVLQRVAPSPLNFSKDVFI